jgi:hypothetical protein
MLLPSENNTLAYTWEGRTPSSPGQRKEAEESLKSFLSAQSVKTFESGGLGTHCLIKFPNSFSGNCQLLASDWQDGWYRPSFDSLAIIHDHGESWRRFERLDAKGTVLAGGRLRSFGRSDLVAVKPSLNNERLNAKDYDTLDGEAFRYVSGDHGVKRSLIAISGARASEAAPGIEGVPASGPSPDFTKAIWHDMETIQTVMMGGKTISMCTALARE